MNQAQFNAALKELDALIAKGSAELKQRPEQFRRLTELQQQLKTLKPGAKPSAKLVSLVEAFFRDHLEDGIREQTRLMQESRQIPGPVMAKVTAAHKATLQALTDATRGLAALDPDMPRDQAAALTDQVKRSTETAESAMEDATVAVALAAAGAVKPTAPSARRVPARASPPSPARPSASAPVRPPPAAARASAPTGRSVSHGPARTAQARAPSGPAKPRSKKK